MKKKIIFHNGSLRMGGIERVLVEVLQNLDLKKFEIELLIEDEFKEENIFEKDIPKEIKITYLRPEWLLQKTKWLRERKRNIFYKIFYNLFIELERQIRNNNLNKFLKITQAEVLVDFDMGLNKVAHKINMRKIAWIHASINNWYEEKNKIERLGKRLKNYDKIVTICDEMKKETIELYPFLEDKIVRIYNPFNFYRIKTLSENIEEITNEQNKLYEDDYFISVMRLTTKQKDFFTLLKAYKKLIKSGRKEKLLIFGDGPDKNQIEKMIKELNLEKKALLMGSVKNPYPWIKNAKLFVHSSKYEGLPTVLIEAMILRKVIVSSDCPTGPKEILDNGKCGVLVKVGDVEDLVRCIEYGIKNKNEYLRKLERRVEEFNSKNVIKEYEKIIMV